MKSKIVAASLLFAAFLAITFYSYNTVGQTISANNGPNTRTVWLYQSGTANNFSPNGVVMGNTGDLCVDQNSQAEWIKGSGYSTTGWVQTESIYGTPTMTTTGTATGLPTKGSIIISATSAKIYLSATNGLLVASGTVAAISGTGYNF